MLIVIDFFAPHAISTYNLSYLHIRYVRLLLFGSFPNILHSFITDDQLIIIQIKNLPGPKRTMPLMKSSFLHVTTNFLFFFNL